MNHNLIASTDMNTVVTPPGGAASDFFSIDNLSNGLIGLGVIFLIVLVVLYAKRKMG